MSTDTPAPTTVADVEEALRDVIDPELGINVVDLGLIYGVNLDAAEAGTPPIATIDMTLTSAACPLTDVIEHQAERVGGERRAHRGRAITAHDTHDGALRRAKGAVVAFGEAVEPALEALGDDLDPSAHRGGPVRG